ncbi:hypothetical protein [Maledivibacter halophilus]|uniref:Uncharacterized protein n=1 Tax=Maledivibacter halophilus TaxID=36842 RepID=A0A1T5KS86_9FIRM|nr:hypothetical protein [Maledivibacter halophilus]SKC66500.1 hypothetical protein SAMN02194393_02110 [Maledivibacter halophilus]
MNKIKEYEAICKSLINLLDIDEKSNLKITQYINNYGVVNFFKNTELMELPEDAHKKLQAIQDVLFYIENVDSRHGGEDFENQ